VFVPADVPRLFLMETRAYGAEVETVEGLITDAGKVCAARAKQNGWYDCATLKEPYRVEGKKTMGYELAEQMGWKLPDAILYPTGGGTGLIGMWKAFRELEVMGFLGPGRPRMYAIQAEGCAPIVKAFSEGLDEAAMWEGASTLAHGLRVPKALGDFLILRALRESHGAAIAVSDQEIVQGVKDAASSEGIFMAPEGGACVAALRKLKANGHLSADDTIVVFNTGTGFKYVEVMAPLWDGPPGP
jgi:threonine synthase